ncbi:MAG: hypothetical protein IPM35_22930 [Myxococcales bacterium]|nr:hypothetical protein [Myxococcales bacterium]
MTRPRHVAHLAVVAALVLAASAEAKTLKLRAPSQALSLECGTSKANWSFHDGIWYQRGRELVKDTTKFGASGTVKDDFVFNPPFDSFDPGELDGADILLLNPVKIQVDRQVFMPFRTYALGGVGFISFQNEGVTFMADKSDCAGENVANVTSAGGATPVMNGPFGLVGATFSTGWNCSFKNMESGVVELATNSKGPNSLLLDLGASSPGSARAVSFGDEEHFAGPYLESGCGSMFVTQPANEKLFLNTLAWVAQTAHDPIPDEVEGTGDTDGDGKPDYLDGDNDGDNILDLFEAGDKDPTTPPVDTDKDGKPDYNDDDSDGDGVKDSFESPGDPLLPPADTDKDGKPDFQDTDSDDDTILDGVDNCRLIKNTDQKDTDKDGMGDVCDGTPGDPDAGSGGSAGGGGSGGGFPDASPIDGSTLGGSGGDSGGGGKGSTNESSDDGGCGCRVGGSGSASTSWIALFALGLVTGYRRSAARTRCCKDRCSRPRCPCTRRR